MARKRTASTSKESWLSRSLVGAADGAAAAGSVLLRVLVGPAGRIVGMCMLVVGIAVGFARYAKGLDTFVVNTADIKIMQRPDWLTPEIENEIKAPPGMPQRFSIFEENLAPTLAKLYERYPWVAKVEEVRKEYPNQVYVRFELRRPAARVQVGEFFHYVDQHGARLSEQYYNLNQGLGLPLIVGASRDVPLPGESWPGGAVQAALEVTDILIKHNLVEDLGLNVVDVSNFGAAQDERRSDIVFYQGYRTPAEVRVEWGRAPSTAKYGELAPETKIANLKTMTSRFPGLQGIKILKLQFDDPFWSVR